MLGLLPRNALPDDHRNAESKEPVRLAIGLVATMSAMVLGLLVSSAKSFYDAQSAEVAEISAKFVLLDRILAHYGPEAKEPRDVLRTLWLTKFKLFHPRTTINLGQGTGADSGDRYWANPLVDVRTAKLIF